MALGCGSGCKRRGLEGQAWPSELGPLGAGRSVWEVASRRAGPLPSQPPGLGALLGGYLGASGQAQEPWNWGWLVAPRATLPTTVPEGGDPTAGLYRVSLGVHRARPSCHGAGLYLWLAGGQWAAPSSAGTGLPLLTGLLPVSCLRDPI